MLAGSPESCNLTFILRGKLRLSCLSGKGGREFTAGGRQGAGHSAVGVALVFCLSCPPSCIQMSVSIEDGLSHP
jgi:hypothetical protein